MVQNIEVSIKSTEGGVVPEAKQNWPLYIFVVALNVPIWDTTSAVSKQVKTNSEYLRDQFVFEEYFGENHRILSKINIIYNNYNK